MLELKTKLKDFLKDARLDSSVFTAQLTGKACQLGCPKIVLDHMRVYIYIYIYIHVCMLWISSTIGCI